jgi:hypothetical protein
MRIAISSERIVARRELVSVTGERINVPDDGAFVHLQFRRFAGCPVCDLHLRSIVKRHDEIVRANVREVVLFHSTDEELRPYAPELPFAVVGDPEKRLYAEFGVESAVRALLDPRAWWAIFYGVLLSLWAIVRGKKPLPPKPRGGRIGLPADFLIAPDGRVVASHYGAHAYDQWSVDEILALRLGSQ